VTSLKTTEAAFGVQVSEQTEVLRELLFRGENIESHALHVFLLAAPDYLGYPSAPAMAREFPEIVKLGLELKQLGNRVQEVIGGRAIHPTTPVLGGFAALPGSAQLVELRDRVARALERVPELLEFVGQLPPEHGCFADTVFAALAPDQYGYSRTADVTFKGQQRTESFEPSDYRTFTNEMVVAHSNARHSLFEGAPFMVGALARLTINEALLDADALAVLERVKLLLPSGDPLDNNKAQAVELVLDLQWCLVTLERLLADGVRVEAPVFVVPRAGTATVITEAPRGLLVHSYCYNEDYRIASADVITPTAMNAASIERHFQLGVAQSTDKTDAVLTRRLEMIARAYDPCISCSVHLVRLRDNAG
ncbi:MAG TPA: nickel-dependent hydrogenase large subunit, partial [Longimicrobiales bacterium]